MSPPTASKSTNYKFASALWRQGSSINPKTGRKWATSDELKCSCGASVLVGRYGFSKLTQHHRTAEHGLQLQQRILKASNAPTTTADTLPALTAAAVAGPPVTVKSTTSTVPNIARFFAMSPSARKQKAKNTQGTGYRTPVLEPGTCSPSVIRT